MIVILDSNEQATSKRTYNEVRQIFPSVLVSKLTCGDLNVILDDGTKLAIERKEVHDFLASIGDGRLFSQVENMANNSKYYFIIIEGELGFKEDIVTADGEETNWKGKAVRAALWAVGLSACPVFFVPKGSYAYVVEEIIDFVSKEDERVQLTHKRIVTFPPVSLEVDILAAFPGIGIKRAESLMEFAEQGKHGGLINALAWGAAMPKIPKGNRPKYWGDAVADNFRKTLGLNEGEYIDVKKE